MTENSPRFPPPSAVDERLREFRSELPTCSAGKHDDQADALGLIGQVLDRMTAAQAEAKPLKLRGMHEMTMDEPFDLATQKPDRLRAGALRRPS